MTAKVIFFSETYKKKSNYVTWLPFRSLYLKYLMMFYHLIILLSTGDLYQSGLLSMLTPHLPNRL